MLLKRINVNKCLRILQLSLVERFQPTTCWPLENYDLTCLCYVRQHEHINETPRLSVTFREKNSWLAKDLFHQIAMFFTIRSLMFFLLKYNPEKFLNQVFKLYAEKKLPPLLSAFDGNGII